MSIQGGHRCIAALEDPFTTVRGAHATDTRMLSQATKTVFFDHTTCAAERRAYELAEAKGRHIAVHNAKLSVGQSSKAGVVWQLRIYHRVFAQRVPRAW